MSNLQQRGDDPVTPEHAKSANSRVAEDLHTGATAMPPVELSAIIVVPQGRGPMVTGLTLGERGRRVAVRAGVDAAHVHLVKSHADVAAIAPQLAGRAVLLIAAHDQVVAVQLVEPLLLDQPGSRRAIDSMGYAGAVRIDAHEVPAALDALRGELDGRTIPAADVEVNHRARHKAGSPEELRAAKTWQWQIVNKPQDSVFTKYFWRPCARPLTWLFVQLPFSPNQISVGCIALAIAGGIVAGGTSYGIHLLGIALLFLSALADNVDGEVARLRMQSSKMGGWLDTIGDDVSRLAILWGLGMYTRHLYPELPIGWVLAFTVANTLVSFALLYWWCIFVGKTYNNQDYAKSLGLGPGVDKKEPGGLGKLVSEVGILLARRDFLDIGVTVLAICGLSWFTFAGLCLGQLIGFIVLLPMHFKIVAKRRDERAALAEI